MQRKTSTVKPQWRPWRIMSSSAASTSGSSQTTSIQMMFWLYTMQNAQKA